MENKTESVIEVRFEKGVLIPNIGLIAAKIGIRLVDILRWEVGSESIIIYLNE
jgi:hypothetical protein